LLREHLQTTADLLRQRGLAEGFLGEPMNETPLAV